MGEHEPCIVCGASNGFDVLQDAHAYLSWHAPYALDPLSVLICVSMKGNVSTDIRIPIQEDT